MSSLKLKKAYYCDDDICLYQGCTHSQYLFGICKFKDEATNIRSDFSFDNHSDGLCRYNVKANLTVCNAVYVKPTLFRKGCSYMHLVN
ncbi:hypothetical protein H8356DRAFT_946892 [Neocallimastix lanati (nom. inval.)]|nr:hypothetical protein H8356DRAFT_946892 [Neocallimastix sp. JGI-2020a]